MFKYFEKRLNQTNCLYKLMAEEELQEKAEDNLILKS